MKLRELFEKTAQSTTIGVCFGRWNPPHKGHRAAWETAAQYDHFFIGTNQNTQGPNDPLPYDVKLIAMATVWPEVEGHVIPETNLFTLATKIFSKYGEGAHLKVCTDEAWLADGLVKYNGKEGKHGYYNFASIEQVPTPRLSSATSLRAAARRGDREEFSAAAGVPADTVIHVGKKGVKFFDLVSKYLNEFPEPKKKTAVAEASNGQGIKMKGKTGKMDKSLKSASKNMTTLPDQNMSSGSAYLGYRMGIALAGAPTYPTKMDGDTWLGGDPLMSPYTKEEFEMVKAAAKQVGGGRIENWSGDRSKETADVNKTSTVAKVKRNKYGV